MTQLMPLPLTVSCFSKTQIGFTFLALAHPGKKGKGSPYLITERRVPELIPVRRSVRRRSSVPDRRVRHFQCQNVNIFSNKIYGSNFINGTRKQLLWFEISQMPIAV